MNFTLKCFLFLKECDSSLQAWHGDGYCDDDLNNQACGFDGGDCCLEDVLTTFCIECLCLENEQTTLVGSASGKGW